MSLKAVHIIFIAASTLLAFGFSAWALLNYAQGSGRSDLYLGIASAALGVGLIVYGRYFLKKLRNIDFL